MNNILVIDLFYVLQLLDACLHVGMDEDCTGLGCDNMTCIIIVFNKSEKIWIHNSIDFPDCRDTLPSDVHFI